MRYAAAIALVALAGLTNGILWEWIRPQAGPLLLLAVLMSAHYGGRGPGMLAAVLATLGRAIFYQEPLLDPLIETRDLLMAPIFLVSALFVTWITAARSDSDTTRRQPAPQAQSHDIQCPPAHTTAPAHPASAPSAVADLMRGLGGARAAVMTFAPPLALLALAVLLRLTVNIPIGALTRDRVHFFGGPFYTGAYSTLGFLLWASTAFVCFFTATRMKGLAVGLRERRMFFWAGVFSLLLLADDMLMLHEVVFPQYFGVRDPLVIVVLALAGLIFTIRFRREILARLPVLFIVTVACFAGSLLFDAVPTSKAQYLLEDGFKLLGIAGWLSFWSQRAALHLTQRPAQVAAGDEPPRQP